MRNKEQEREIHEYVHGLLREISSKATPARLGEILGQEERYKNLLIDLMTVERGIKTALERGEAPKFGQFCLDGVKGTIAAVMCMHKHYHEGVTIEE